MVIKVYLVDDDNNSCKLFPAFIDICFLGYLVILVFVTAVVIAQQDDF